MIGESHNHFFESVLFQATGQQIPIKGYQMMSGGCINNAVKIIAENKNYFLKWNDRVDEDVFEVEAKGLSTLKETNTIRIPDVINTGKIGGNYYILLEFLESSIASSSFWEDFGASLAKLHQSKGASYGLSYKNYIGSLPQKNIESDSWIDFFIENRLEVQLGLAIYNGHVDTQFAKKFRILYPQLPGLLSLERPTLIHGDLWSGNFITGPGGKAALIDPAIYFGHREVELAFTQLFGGFDNLFYLSYFEHYPVEPGFSERAEIYNLYPLLVHVNLFGRSYIGGIDSVLRKYC